MVVEMIRFITRFLDMLMSFLAVIFTLEPSSIYTVQAKNYYIRNTRTLYIFRFYSGLVRIISGSDKT